MFIVEIDDSEFSPLPRKATGWTDPLVVYRRSGVSREDLVLFVHGLGGYAHRTWGRYPEFVLTDDLGADVGMLDYESGPRRRAGRSIKLEDHAAAFSHSIRDLEGYKRVVLVGHSMGGLLCKAAIRELLNSRTRDKDGRLGVDKVAGVMLFATPQAGSRRVPRVLSAFSKDARALQVGSVLAKDTAQCFTDSVVTSLNYQSPTSKKPIPTFAIVATGDRWVDQLSAGLNLEMDQKKIVTGGHSSIVNPASRDDDAYVWFRDRVSMSLEKARFQGTTRLTERTTPPIDLRDLLRGIVQDMFAGGLDVPMHTDIGISPESFDSPKNEDESSDLVEPVDGQGDCGKPGGRETPSKDDDDE